MKNRYLGFIFCFLLLYIDTFLDVHKYNVYIYIYLYMIIIYLATLLGVPDVFLLHLADGRQKLQRLERKARGPKKPRN